jgi:hypothetical protein
MRPANALPELKLLNTQLQYAAPALVSLNSLFCYELRTKNTQQLHRQRIVVWWKGAPLRLRLCKTRSPPFCRLAGPLREFLNGVA